MEGELWLLRHGDAEPHGARPDFERRLTARGEHEAREAGRAIAALGVDFRGVYTSPRVRARDTARLAAEAWGGDAVVHEPLSKHFDAGAAAVLMDAAGAGARVLVVGHEPDFSRTVHELTGATIGLKKGGLAIVQLDGGSGRLLMLARPRDLELIAGSR
jgi:phosphohistidine phosphatase